MGVGVERAGVHVPRYRLSGEEAGAFWGTGGPQTSRTVANWDEDAVTMAVAAARQCIAGIDTATIDSVLLASVSFPYVEKQSAALVAEALNLPLDVETMDVSSSLRAGTQALRFAADRVAVTGDRVLLVVSEARPTSPDSADEAAWGDAAVALLIGPDAPVSVQWVNRTSETWLASWRLDGDTTVQHGDARFVSELTTTSLGRGLEAGVKAAADQGAQVAAVATAAPRTRDVTRAIAASGLPDRVQVHGPDLQAQIGYGGTAAPFLALLDALQQATAGDTVLWACVGDGVDSALVTIGSDVPRTDLQAQVAAGRALSYGEYARLRGLLAEPDVVPFSSEIEQWRDAERVARLQANRCGVCGHIAYPPQPTCPGCHRYGEMEHHRLADNGALYTFTVEHLFPNPERRLAMGVVELDDGVRFYCPITDAAPDELAIGQRMRLVFRRLHTGGGFINYFWKATPAEMEISS